MELKRPVFPWKAFMLSIGIIIILIAVLILNGCRKNDLSSNAPAGQTVTGRFFRTTSTDPTVLRIINRLKGENERIGFVNKLPPKCGLPVWDKLSLRHSTFVIMRTEVDTSETVLIPLTTNSSNLSAVIVATPGSNGYAINCYTTNGDLYDICHAPKPDVAKAEQMLAMFMQMENRVYGTNTFYHIPSGLFKNPASSKLTGAEKPVTIETDPPQGLVEVNCFIIKYCNPGNVCTPPTYCDHCEVCPWEYYCYTTPGEDPPSPLPPDHIPPTNPPPGGPGGGGGGSTPTSPPPTTPPPVPPTNPNPPTPIPPDCLWNSWYSENFIPIDDCGPQPPVDSNFVKELLKKDMLDLKPHRDSVWNKAYSNDEEWHFFIKEENGVSKAKADTTDHDPDGVTPNQQFSKNGNPNGDYHTHQDHPNPSYRHPHDPQDLCVSNANRPVLYRSYVDCGDVIYVVVNENLALIKKFFRNHNLTSIQQQQPWKDLSTDGSNRRVNGLQGLITLLGSSNISGFGLYKSTNADKTEFVKIN